MTSFVTIKYSTQHPGVARVESAIDAAAQLRRGLTGPRGLAALLLSAVTAAFMVVAYQIMDSVAEGHLLVMWIALWVVAFVALALFAGSARRGAARLLVGLDGWSRRMAEGRADRRLWAAALTDPRVMADLQMAIQRNETSAEIARVATRTAIASAPKAEHTVQLGDSSLPAYQRNYI